MGGAGCGGFKKFCFVLQENMLALGPPAHLMVLSSTTQYHQVMLQKVHVLVPGLS